MKGSSIGSTSELEAQIVYCVSPQAVAWSGIRNFDPKEFYHRLDQPSIAATAFLEGHPYFSKDPWTDSSVSKAGLRKWQITSPLLAIPLLFQQKKSGALVVWK